ncbi:MAG: sulfate adenylyltransferase [Chloroflexi bacterium]|nr:sulfate adenylyltransferase [Chloroflexota bacterium]
MMKNGFTVWLTGLSGAGKSTIAALLAEELKARNHAVEMLDGDEVRKNLSAGLGFSREDRDANVRRIGWVAAMATRHGAAVIVAAISPYREVREEVRRQIGSFVEVYVKCPLDVLKRRDPKGLYKKAVAGEIRNFTGISDPYEEPSRPEIVIETSLESPAESARKLVDALANLGLIYDRDAPTLQTPAHGGRLIERSVGPEAADELRARAGSLPSIRLSQRQLSDLYLMGVGALSPLRGFMNRADYYGVIENMRLASGLVWPMPVTLSIPGKAMVDLARSQRAALRDDEDRLVGILNVEDIFEYDKETEARNVFRTDDWRHPGVAALYEQDDVYVGGEVEAIGPLADFGGLDLTPAESRAEFRRRGWKTVVGFQTRNPIHRAHEYLLKVALELNDGLFVNPLIGPTKSDDIPAEVRMQCYEALLGEYFPPERIVLGVLPAAMRYAGPREAVFHALIRKNYGCTHFIVGRDHAGVGDYYGPYDAQRIFESFDPDELGIVPIPFENAVFCKTCEGIASFKTCPHPSEHHLALSGTKVRQMLSSGQSLPAEFTRPGVADVLREHYNESGTPAAVLH